MQHWDMYAIIDACNRAGSHWFDAWTMRFFGTRLPGYVYQGPGGVYFLTSEKPPHGPRMWSVRRFNPLTADISTVQPFCGLSPRQARSRAAELARDKALADCG